MNYSFIFFYMIKWGSMTHLNFGGLEVLFKKNMVMGLFHFSKRRLVNEKKPFKKESLWYKAMDEACTVHQTRTLVERMKRVTNSQVKPIIIRKTPQYSGFGHCSLCDMIVSRKWKWKCKQEITTRTLSICILYLPLTISFVVHATESEGGITVRRP